MTKKHQKSPPRTVAHKDWRLRKASDYLEFDIHTFAASLEIHFANRGTEQGNAALDSALIRARLLVDFFMRKHAKRDDVIALDFFHDYSPKPFVPMMSRTVKREREKINKRLMHLTTKPMPRLRSNQKYAIRDVARPILAGFRAWLEIVPDCRLQRPARKTGRDYDRHLSRLEKLVK